MTGRVPTGSAPDETVLFVRTRKVFAALLVPALLALSACGDEVEGDNGATDEESSATDSGTEEAAEGGEPAAEGELEGVEVTGAVDEKPTVTVDAPPFEIDETTAQVIEEGEGDAVVEETNSVAAGFTVVNGRTGEELESSYTSGQPATFAVSEESGLIPGLYRGLLGQQEGGRVAVAVPPADAFGETGNPQIGVEPTDTLIFVFDITAITEVTPPLEMAEGTEVDPPADVPSVVTDDEGIPTGFETTDETPEEVTESESSVLIEGEGAEVESGQEVTVHYLGQLYPGDDAEIFDQSWERGEPASFPIGTGGVIPCWDELIPGATIGSRIELVCTAEDAYGAQGSPPTIPADAPLLFVVDVLGANAGAAPSGP